jgi:hypothetical protein
VDHSLSSFYRKPGRKAMIAERVVALNRVGYGVRGWAAIAIPSFLAFRFIGYRLVRRYRIEITRVANSDATA